MTNVGRPPTGSIVWADPETKTQLVGASVRRRQFVQLSRKSTACPAPSLTVIACAPASSLVVRAQNTISDTVPDADVQFRSAA